MEELKKKIEALEQEKTDLLQKFQTTQEDLKAVSKEKDSLKILVEDLQAERNNLNSTMHGLYKTIEKTVAANLELQDYVRATAKSSKGCCEILKEAQEALLAKGPQTPEGQEMMASPTASLGEKVKTVTTEQARQITEKEEGLVIENKRLMTNLEEVMLENSYHRRRVMDFWETIFSLRVENDHLRQLLITLTEKMVLSKLPVMEKKRDNIALLALNLKGDLETMKSVAAEGLSGLPHAQTANVLKLQGYFEQATEELYTVLTNIEYYFAEWYRECKEYYVSISKFTTNLLDENLKQFKLLIEIQNLKKSECCRAEFNQLDIPALRQRLDIFLENISQDLCALEEQLLGIESKAQQLENNKEGKKYVENCSALFSIQEFEKGLRNDIKKLRNILEHLKPKLKCLDNARQEVAAKHACYVKEAEAAVKSCKGRSEQWQKDLKAVKEEMDTTGHQELEEDQKLGENLSLIEKQMTDHLDKAAKIEREELEGLISHLAKTSLSEQEAKK
ncbi:centromere-associated protein E-like [Ahaetulla prasina]|uniref:centromere-associated protein E-like n=1 Tax=Ahaetulla prasina TaxID=499056 RepID=UPI0026496830|nr:centromere-associated protein E-like [Ahaetulla prasina]